MISVHIGKLPPLMKISAVSQGMPIDRQATTDREKTYREMKEKLRVVQINRDGNIRAVTEVT